MAAPPRCGPFELLKPIGEGASGVVWRARHRLQDVEVALKVLAVGSERLSAAFRNEVRAAARLDHHNIVMLFEQGHISPEDAKQSNGVLQAGSPFLAMELCTGGALAQRRPRASWPLLRRQLGEILAGLAHAHSRGVIHRDLKPSNTLLQGEGDAAQVKLSDFGIAHALVMHDTEADARNERLSGTLQYMAPEQLSGQWRDEGPWTDLYALGVMTYEAVSGRSPWRATTRGELVAALLKGAPPVRPRMPVPDGLQEWLDSLLDKRTVDRFQSAAAALLALQSLADPVVWEPGFRAKAAAAMIAASPTIDATDGPSPAALHGTPQRSLSLQGVGLGLYGLRPARLAGRKIEKQQVWNELLSMVRSQRPSVILLRGPMGVGTSKLAEWLSENAHSTLGASLMAATHGPIPGPGDGLPAMVGRYLQCSGLDHERRQSRCARIITDFPLHDDSAFEAAALDDLVALGESSNRSLAVAAQEHALRRTLRRLARIQPLILTIDNGQWANSALCLAEKLLDDDPRSLPLLLLILVDEEALAPGSAEEQKLAALEARPRSLTLRLGDITANAHRGLVKDLLDLEPSLLDQVCAVTSGDALFASSLLRHWVRTHALDTSEKGFVLGADAPQILPTSLNALWDHQLRELATKLDDIDIEQLLSSLEIAAALGESVYDNEWRAACARAGIPIRDELAACLSELNIVSHTHLGWRFKHGLMRQHLETQGRRAGRREEQHRACAAALKTLSHDNYAMQGRIGEHWLEAGAADESFLPLLRGAIQARERSDWSESHRLFALLESAFAGDREQDLQRRIEAQMERIPCFVSQGHIEQALAITENALVCVQERHWTKLEALARMARASIAFAQSDVHEASLQLKQALALLGDTDPILKLNAHTRLGSLCMWKRELPQASEHFAAAQAIIGDDPAYVAERGQTLRGMSHVAHCHGDFASATELMLEAQACFETQGNRLATAGCINDLGELERHQGKLDLAETHYRRALERYESLGAADATTAKCNLGYLLIARGAYREARNLLQALLDSALARERHIDRMWILCGLWACAAAQARWQEWDLLQAQIHALGDTGIFDEDLAKVTQRAGDLARMAGHQKRANSAYSVALSQWDGMHKHAKAAEIRQLLADLGTSFTD